MRTVTLDAAVLSIPLLMLITVTACLLDLSIPYLIGNYLSFDLSPLSFLLLCLLNGLALFSLLEERVDRFRHHLPRFNWYVLGHILGSSLVLIWQEGGRADPTVPPYIFGCIAAGAALTFTLTTVIAQRRAADL